MIGPRCLGSGGSAIRSSAARAPSKASLTPSVAPFAECSYRTWQPPQVRSTVPQQQARADASGCIRCFSSASGNKRSHNNPPQAAISVDQHGIESILHDPPFTQAKVKRLRPVADPQPEARGSRSNQPASNSRDPAYDTTADSSSSFNKAQHYTGAWSSPLHPPGSALASQLTANQSTFRSRPDIPASLLVDYLTAPNKETFLRVEALLPNGFRRIDAYLALRESDPQSLAALSYLDIFSLIEFAGKDGLGSVLALILEDIVGSDTSNTKAKCGHFQIFSGTEKRYKLLREILIQCTRGEFLLHDGAALNVFMLMLDDLIQLRQSPGHGPIVNTDVASGSGEASSLAEGADVLLPSNFPVGETRRLVKLAVHLHSPELAPILHALRAHLEAHTPDFPTAREGAQLIAYFLQPNLREFGAALDVVRGLRDTNALAQELVDDAIHDGKKYMKELEAVFSSDTEDGQGRPSDDELQQICMDVSLRLIAMKSLMAQRPKGGVQYRKALESLVASFRLDLVDSSQTRRGCDMPSLLDVPLRSIRSVFLHLIGQNDKSCLMEAVFALQRCDQRLVAMLPESDLQEFCDAARTQGGLRSATEMFAQFAQAKTSFASNSGLPISYRHFLARDGLMTDTDTFLALMRQLLADGQKITVIALLRALRLLPLAELVVGQLNLRFRGVQRSRLVALFADVGLVREAFELFQYWSQWRYDIDADSADPVNLRRAGAVQVADPLIERQIRLMHDTDRQVSMSTDCLIALVRGICRQPLGKSEDGSTASSSECPTREAPRNSKVLSERLKKARFVIDVFKQACAPIDWNHYRLTALAQACFIAKDVPGAFDALAKISFLRQIPDQVDISVLLGGLVEHDADKAVDLFIQHCSIPEVIAPEAQATKGEDTAAVGEAKLQSVTKLAPMKPTPALTSMLIARAIAQGRIDLAERLYEFSKAVGIYSRLGYVASLRAAFLRDISPNKVRATIDRMLQNGWIADPALLEKLAQRLLSRSMQRRPVIEGELASDPMGKEAPAPKTKPVPPKERLQLVRAATHLMKISARTKEVVNLRTAHRALDAIVQAKPLSSKLPSAAAMSTGNKGSGVSGRSARERGQDERRLQLIASLDSIVHMLRWTKFFDTGDDYRQSLALWKSGSRGNGNLVSAELDEMMKHGFRGSRHRWKQAQTSSAAAATLPTSAESPPDATEEVDDDGEAPESMQTDGVMQQWTTRVPNVLPADLFRRLIETYLALGDALGAAEVASWMRDEAKVDIARTPQETSEFVSRIKAAVLEREAKVSADQHTGDQSEGSNILRMLAGQQSTAHTKRWWTP
ncbi:uncharacterized protein UTRI_01268_B [Ustilago trichophora]|uniref:Uncharacterized protein n=1 Tax=Ustilago trichophora TaxID=86804 RepID=A0A5C3DU81_9BASI|nr:uncharacterized protein UTRI_01268_B [Ustilago trichophora]